MTSKHVFNNKAYARLKGGLSAAATTMELHQGGYMAFSPGWESGEVMYLTITDFNSNIEIIKVTALSTKTGQFTIARGQDGTSARQWYDGAIVTQRLVAANLEMFIQREAFRTSAVDPNGVVTCDFVGEWLFQTGAGWWKALGGTVWQGVCILSEFQYIDNYNPLTEEGLDVWSDGTFIYLAYGDGGLYVFSLINNEFNFIDSDDQGGAARGVFGDGDFIFVANSSHGIEVYSVDESGNLTHIDNDDKGGTARGVWCDGDYIYLANGTRGIEVYEVDGAGNLTHKYNHYLGAGEAIAVFGDGTFIFVDYDVGLASYSKNGDGTLNNEDAQAGGDATGDYRGLYCDGNWIFHAKYGDGLNVWSVDENGDLTLVDNDDQGSSYVAVWGDGTYIYAATNGAGFHRYTVGIAGALTYVDTFTASCLTSIGLFGYDFYLFVAAEANGITLYGKV